MAKPTINEIEQIIDTVLSLDQLKEDGFEAGDAGQWAENLIDKLDLELAIRKLTSGDQEIIRMIQGGFTFREIQDELKVSPLTIREAKEALYGIMNSEEMQKGSNNNLLS